MNITEPADFPHMQTLSNERIQETIIQQLFQYIHDMTYHPRSSAETIESLIEGFIKRYETFRVFSLNSIKSVSVLFSITKETFHSQLK